MKDNPISMEIGVCTRQYLVFPFQATARASRRRVYRLLALTDDGKLVFLELKHRKLAANDIHKIISILSGDNAYAHNSVAAGRLYELGIEATFLDEPINAASSFCTNQILGEAILDEMLSASQTSASDRDELESKLKARLRDGTSQFICRLRPEVVQTIFETGHEPAPSIYNYLAGGKTDEEILYRIQAARAFPVLVQALAKGNGLREIHEAIRNQRPLIAAVAQAFGVPVSVARCLRSATMPVRTWSGRPHILFKLLALLPPDFRPKDMRSWVAFNEAVETISTASRMPVLCTRNRLWLYACAARKFKATVLGPSLERAARDIDEFSSALVAVIDFELRREPRHKSVYSISAAHEFIDAQCDIFKVAKLARRYEAAYIRESADFAASGEKALLSGVCWKGVLHAPFNTPSRSIHQIVTAEDLVTEGVEMNHCVAGYTIHCLAGNAVMFSVKDSEGKRCSTLQISISQEQGVIRASLMQHKGKSNVEPPMECKSAAISLLCYLNQNKESLEVFLAWRNSIAGLGKDARALLALTRPMSAALRKVLPSAWPLERFISLAREKARKEQAP